MCFHVILKIRVTSYGGESSPKCRVIRRIGQREETSMQILIIHVSILL